MADDKLIEEYILKRKEYKETKLKLEELEDRCAKLFVMTVAKEQINDLREFINSEGNLIHKKEFEDFCCGYENGELSDERILAYESLSELYVHKISIRKQRIIDFYSNIKMGYVNELKEIIDKHGVPVHKVRFNDFYQRYCSGELTDGSMSCFSEMVKIYRH